MFAGVIEGPFPLFSRFSRAEKQPWKLLIGHVLRYSSVLGSEKHPLSVDKQPPKPYLLRMGVFGEIITTCPVCGEEEAHQAGRDYRVWKLEEAPAYLLDELPAGYQCQNCERWVGIVRSAFTVAQR